MTGAAGGKLKLPLGEVEITAAASGTGFLGGRDGCGIGEEEGDGGQGGGVE